jgi:hypothetical protein
MHERKVAALRIDPFCAAEIVSVDASPRCQNGGYARAGSTSGGGGASPARRIAGGVTTGSGVASRRAGGLWTARGGHRFDLPWCGWPPGTALWGFNSVLWGFNSAARVIGAGLRAVRERPAAAGGCRGAFLGREPGDAAAAARPGHGAPSRPAAFVVSAGHRIGLRSRLALPSPSCRGDVGPARPWLC